MDYYCRILTNIFSTTFSKDDTKDFMSCLEAANKYLDHKLENFTEKIDETRENEIIAPPLIVWDVDNAENITNLVKISKNRLSITSQSAFSTLKSNACVIAGRYMYEIQLKSKGVMQIGFCSSHCKFTQDTGVGDTRYSYGLGKECLQAQKLHHNIKRYYRFFDYMLLMDINCCAIKLFVS